ncbi:hypothetical protein, partial [Burkholderia sp. BCC1977]|uniref:hypothetical protein n=1 Tax=Burkholderia sp. BCC1977 TaxID=2817440 RepID=UPI002ABD7492
GASEMSTAVRRWRGCRVVDGVGETSRPAMQTAYCPEPADLAATHPQYIRIALDPPITAHARMKPRDFVTIEVSSTVACVDIRVRTSA